MDNELQKQMLSQLELINANLNDLKDMVRGVYREFNKHIMSMTHGKMYPTYLATCKDKDDIPEEDSLYELVYGIYKNTRR